MIYERAVWWPGAAAGYRWGRTPLLSCVAHYTVGRDSAGIGLRGIFHFLVRRNGEIVQFCEADAKAFHAGDPYNSRGPGIEVEYLPGVDDEMFTGVQLDACGDLVRWLGGLGIPLAYYDDPANRVGDWNGFISHRSITSNADFHSDYWEQADWARMVSPAPPPVKEDTMRLIKVKETGEWVLVTPFGAERGISPDRVWEYVAGGIPSGEMPAAYVDAFINSVKALVPKASGGGAAVPLTVKLTGTATP